MTNLKQYNPALRYGAEIDVSGSITTATDLTCNGDTTIGDAATDTFTVNTAILLPKNGGAASASGLLMGVGTSADPATTAVANAKFIEVRAETTATSGDNRLAYLRYSVNGATGGECIRAFTKVTSASATTVRGAHISIDFAAAGTASGFAAGVDAQALLPDASLASCVTALNCELYSSGTSTASTGVTSFIRCVLGGNATGLAAIEDTTNLFSIIGGTVASGNLIEAETDETKLSHKIRMQANGTTYYLMATTS